MKTIRIILFVLIIIGLGFLVTEKLWVPKLVNKILAYQGLEMLPNQVLTSTNSALSPTINQTSSSNATVDWQTYKGTGFSVKYPPAWSIIENQETNNETAIIFTGNKLADSFTPNLRLNILGNGGSNNTVLGVANSNYWRNHGGEVSTSTVLIDGVMGTKVEEISPATGHNWNNDDMYVLFEIGNTKYYQLQGSFEQTDSSGGTTFNNFYNSLVLSK